MENISKFIFKIFEMFPRLKLTLSEASRRSFNAQLRYYTKTCATNARCVSITDADLSPYHAFHLQCEAEKAHHNVVHTTHTFFFFTLTKTACVKANISHDRENIFFI